VNILNGGDEGGIVYPVLERLKARSDDPGRVVRKLLNRMISIVNVSMLVVILMEMGRMNLRSGIDP
jgi:hypothetical protein